MTKSEREFKVFQIQDGTVIDHIPHWKSLQVIELLDLRHRDSLVTIGIGLNSDKMGKKDLLKIEGRELTESDVNRLALVAPDATINLIRGSRKVSKNKVQIPDRIDRLVRCSNAGCITRHETVPTRFETECRAPLRLRCHYCRWLSQGEDIELL